jgi:carbon-monoxide dehydrogenase medium subunit
VLGSVAATPVRAVEAESLLTGRELTDDLIDQAARQAREETSPITDVRASKDYRSQMVVVLVRRALCANRDILLSDDSND